MLFFYMDLLFFYRDLLNTESFVPRDFLFDKLDVVSQHGEQLTI